MSIVLPPSWLGGLTQHDLDRMKFVGKPVRLRSGGPVIGRVMGSRVTDEGVLVDLEMDDEYTDLLTVDMMGPVSLGET